MSKKETARGAIRAFDNFGVYDIEHHLFELPFSIEKEAGLKIIEDIIEGLRPDEIVRNEHCYDLECDEESLYSAKKHKVALLELARLRREVPRHPQTQSRELCGEKYQRLARGIPPRKVRRMQ